MATAATGGPAVRAFFDEATNTVTYLVWDPATKRGAVIDPVLDWDNRSGEADTESADAVLRALQAGADVALWLSTDQVPAVLDRLEAAVGAGELTMSSVDAAVMRIVATKGPSSRCGG